jgi:hypothetical protein
MAPLKWRSIFQMSMVLEDQIPALIARHLREAKKEKEGFLYGFKTPVLEAGLVQGADTVTVGKDWDLGPQTRRFIPMRVGDTDGRLIRSQRDALVLNFKEYSDDRARGTVSNLTLNMTDNLIPVIEVKLGEVSTFPRITNQHDLINKGKVCTTKVKPMVDLMKWKEPLRSYKFSDIQGRRWGEK